MEFKQKLDYFPFSKIPQYKISRNAPSAGLGVLNADRRTDRERYRQTEQS
jgi:hypothetical protein